MPHVQHLCEKLLPYVFPSFSKFTLPVSIMIILYYGKRFCRDYFFLDEYVKRITILHSSIEVLVKFYLITLIEGLSKAGIWEQVSLFLLPLAFQEFFDVKRLSGVEPRAKKCLTQAIIRVYNRLRQRCLLTFREGKTLAGVAQW